MDIQMPEMNGLDALIAIRERVSRGAGHRADHVLRRRAGAARPQSRRSGLPAEEFLAQRIAGHHPRRPRRKKILSPEASYQLAEHATDDALTPAEIPVLRLIAEGNANKQIADQLSITEETVKGRVKNILSKLGAKDRTHAAMIGLRRGIIEF